MSDLIAVLALPQPKPVASSDGKNVEVLPHLIQYLNDNYSGIWVSQEHSSKMGIIKQALYERTEVGIQRYGTPLMTNNRRDAVVDALQELLDCMQYLYQVKLEADSFDRICSVDNILSYVIHATLDLVKLS